MVQKLRSKEALQKDRLRDSKAGRSSKAEPSSSNRPKRPDETNDEPVANHNVLNPCTAREGPKKAYIQYEPMVSQPEGAAGHRKLCTAINAGANCEGEEVAVVDIAHSEAMKNDAPNLAYHEGQSPGMTAENARTPSDAEKASERQGMKRGRKCASTEQIKRSKASANHSKMIENDTNKPRLFVTQIEREEASPAKSLEWTNKDKPKRKEAEELQGEASKKSKKTEVQELPCMQINKGNSNSEQCTSKATCSGEGAKELGEEQAKHMHDNIALKCEGKISETNRMLQGEATEAADKKRKCESHLPESAMTQNIPLRKHSRLEVFHIGGDSDAEEMAEICEPSHNYPFNQQPPGESEQLLNCGH